MWPFSKREVKDNPVGGIISAWHVGQPVWTQRRYDKLADEGYVKNAIAYRCVKMISSSAATVPWVLKGKGDKEIKTHPLLDLLNNPAPGVGGHALLEAFYAYLMLAGNAYLIAARGNNRPPKELWPLRPDRMKIIPGKSGMPAAFEYTANGQTARFPADPVTGMSDVLHLKEFHPTDDWYGLSRLEAGAYGVDRHNAASKHNKALLDNGARPSGALVFSPIKGTNGVEQAAPQTVIQAAKDELDDKYGGPERAGKSFVFGGNVNWQEMGISPRDMDFAKGKDDAARDICTAFGVPHVLIVPGDSTYNNVREAKLELWEDTILPILDKTVDAFNAWLCPMFGDGLKLSCDLDEISALEPRREAKRTSVAAMLNLGVIDAEEARDALQYGPRPAGTLRLQRGDSMMLTALISGASANPGLLEPLYLYLQSVSLLSAKVTLAEFSASWDTGPTQAELRAAAGLPNDSVGVPNETIASQ
jgi:HK97 family phage portal protein